MQESHLLIAAFIASLVGLLLIIFFSEGITSTFLPTQEPTQIFALEGIIQSVYTSNTTGQIKITLIEQKPQTFWLYKPHFEIREGQKIKVKGRVDDYKGQLLADTVEVIS
jgi:hypothetical protein